MSPLLLEAIRSADEAVEAMENGVRLVQSEEFSQVVASLRDVMVTPEGVILEALGNPHALASAFSHHFDVVFSREKDDSGLYQWVTTFVKFECQVWIIANENIDLTGTAILEPTNSSN